jgi:hypothetical protein
LQGRDVERNEAMNDWIIGAAHVATAVLVFYMGWVMAHTTVKHECQKLGAFYVGEKVYECKEKKA